MLVLEVELEDVEAEDEVEDTLKVELEVVEEVLLVVELEDVVVEVVL